MNFENKDVKQQPQKEIIPDIEDAETARETIKQAMEKGELPVISVPEKYIEAAKNGIQPHSTWIGESIIVGTILRNPYLPKNEKRYFLKIKTSCDQIEPRFTGPDKHFHGVVVFKGPIPSNSIQEINF